MDEAPALTPASQSRDDDSDLTRLHPNYAHALRINAVLTAIPFLVASLVVETALRDQALFPPGVIAGPVLLIALALIIRIPLRRYNTRGYQLSSDRLRVVRGVLWHSDTVVPFSRVQHIDVNQGPIERFLSIATLTLHTAGNHNSSVALPGLGEQLAREMREDIRAHIRRESM